MYCIGDSRRILRGGAAFQKTLAPSASWSSSSSRRSARAAPVPRPAACSAPRRAVNNLGRAPSQALLIPGHPARRLREREEVLHVIEGLAAGFDEERGQVVSLVRLHVVLGPLEVAGHGVLADGVRATVDLHSALVHLLREHAVSRVHEGHGAVLGDAVDLVVVDLHLAELLAEGDALLLLPEVAQVLPDVHDRDAHRGQLIMWFCLAVHVMAW